jgi:hypothetical protein
MLGEGTGNQVGSIAANEERKGWIRSRAMKERGRVLGWLVVGLMLSWLLVPAFFHQPPQVNAAGPAVGGTPPSPASTPVGHAPPERALSAPVYHQVLPNDTDPAINDALEPHVAGLADCAQQRGYLMVFLPGTGGRPTSPYAQNLLNYATNNCMHAIGLNYPDARSVFADCHLDRDPDCYGNWRLQKLDGIPRSPHLPNAPANSIENRLLKALLYLAKTYPQEGWDQYLDGNTVRWEDVIASGDSQGGGEAAMMAKIHSVARVVMFASVTDSIGTGRGPIPGWLSEPSATPAERYFGFAHMEDPWWPAEQKGWAAMELDQFGAIVNVDNVATPYDGSHMLTTDIAYNHSARTGAHGSVVAPTNAQQFSPVWEYLLVPN